MPSPLHEAISTLFDAQICDTRATLPQKLRMTIYTKLGQEYTGFEGRWEDSESRPDLAIEAENALGEPVVKFVLKVGFADTYEDLVRDAQLWLEGRSEVSMFVLVKFKETPAYRCPASLDDDMEQPGIPLKGSEVRFNDVTAEGEYGPVLYQGKLWVGHISEVFMEFWTRDADGVAKRHGDRIDLLHPAGPIQFQLSNFLTINPEDDRTISLDFDSFRHLLRRAIKQLAVDRCRRMLRDRAKRLGRPVDQD